MAKKRETTDDIIRYGVDHGLTNDAIAKLLNVHPETVYKRKEKLGLTKRRSRTKTPKMITSFTVDPFLNDQLNSHSREIRLSRSAIISIAIKEYLERVSQ